MRKRWIFELVNNSLGKEISGEIFESLLYRLTGKQSVKLNVLGKITCLSVPKESQLNKENNLIVVTGSKEDEEYCHNIINENEVTERVNAIDNDSVSLRKVFWKIFGHLKNHFSQRQMFSSY